MARTISLWLSGMAGFLLLLEILFRVLPVSTSTQTGYYTDPLILNYPPHHRWIIATGWDLRNHQRLAANNFGYVAHRDFERNEQAVALIGDSFVEASMLTASDRPGAQLERTLGSRPVFAMGNPGTALLDYAERIRYAHKNFGVRDFVMLMERGDVMQSLCGSGNINGRCLDPKTLEPRVETLPAPGTAKQILRHSALAQYLFSQLKFSPQKLWKQAIASSHPVALVAKDSAPLEARAGSINSPGAAMRDIDAVTDAFFERVKPHVTGRLVIVVDSNRRAMYDGQLAPDPSRARFIQLARAAGATVIDTEPLFQAHWAQSSLKLDVGPYDAHLNKLGVNLIAQAVARTLNRP